MNTACTLHIGFDDTDSPKGMCTTFLAYKIVDYLKKQDLEFLEFPKLIRFNPNIHHFVRWIAWGFGWIISVNIIPGLDM